MFDESRDGHIPYGAEWTPEERRKFAVFTEHCPMCVFKFQYAELMQFIQKLSMLDGMGVEQDDPRYIAMAESISRRQMELIEMGLAIAAEQCGRNAIAARALAN